MISINRTPLLLFVMALMAFAQPDDTRALQTMIDAAASTNGVVTLAPGTYHYTALNIAGKARLRINGNASVTLKETANPVSAWIITGSPNLILSGITFDHESHNGYILDISSPGVRITGCRFIHLGDGITSGLQTAVYIAPGSDDMVLENNSFEHFRASPDSAVRGVYVVNYRNRANASQRTMIRNNRFEDFTGGSDQDGVVIDQQQLSSYSVISNNVFTNVMKRGIKIMTNHTTVQGNTVIRNTPGPQSRSVIAVYGNNSVVRSNHGLASGCYSGCSFYAAYDLGGSNILLESNELTNPAGTTDYPYNCILIDVGEGTNGESKLERISIRSNVFRHYTYAKIAPGTRVTNLTATGNMFIGSRTGVGFKCYPGAMISGSSIYGNKIQSGQTIVSCDDEM